MQAEGKQTFNISRYALKFCGIFQRVSNTGKCRQNLWRFQMIQTKNTKRALLISILSVLVCCAMLVGTTFAWFTDSVSSANNKIASGNLDVELYQVKGGVETLVTEGTNLFSENALWEPGYTEVIYLSFFEQYLVESMQNHFYIYYL